MVYLNGGQAKNTVNAGSIGIDQHSAAQILGRSFDNSRTTGTVGGSRWYSYGSYLYFNYLDTPNAYIANPYLWQDTTGLFPFSSGTGVIMDHNRLTSVMAILDPFAPGFNDPTLYPGQIEITSADAYTIDSIGVGGAYYRGADTSYNDQLRISVSYGNGASSSNLPLYYESDSTSPTTIHDHTAFPYVPFGVDTINYFLACWDTVDNTYRINNASSALHGTSTTAINTTMVTLYPSQASSAFYNRYALGSSVLVPPASGTSGANCAAASIGFVTGNPSYSPTTAYDSIVGVMGTVYMGCFFPAEVDNCQACNTSSPSLSWPPVIAHDFNMGSFYMESATNNNPGIYIPEWFWSSGTNPASLQYPDIDFHISCSTCYLLGVSNVNKNVVSSVKVMPNPANDMVTISGTMSQVSNVTVTVSNLLGEVVATQTYNDVKNLNASINTSNLHSGIYVYTINSNNVNINTGRIVVAH